MQLPKLDTIKICVVGLGYVGLPLAISFSKHFPVVGFDVSAKKLEMLQQGRDPTGEIGDNAVVTSKIQYTSDPSMIRNCNFVIIAVPTPITSDYQPDFSLVESASTIVGKNLSKGSIIVYESTVYPGCTEEICLPLLLKHSGMAYPEEFKLGYSPERINPGDKVHTVEHIVKIVSGCDTQSTDIIKEVYATIIRAGVHVARDIRTAEAAKVIENIQRDINIALVNELSMIFNKLGLSTKEVLEAAGTKWNFHKYTPGLVGGHCIGVDPYYLVYKSLQIGHTPQMIIAGRAINEQMPLLVARATEEKLLHAGKKIHGAKILVLGLTFKANVNDYRNSKIELTLEQLKKHGAEIYGSDPFLSDEILTSHFHVKPARLHNGQYDALIYAQNHHDYSELSLEKIKLLLSNNPILIDLCMRYTKQDAEKAGLLHWSL